jgi:hypothetical protein
MELPVGLTRFPVYRHVGSTSMAVVVQSWPFRCNQVLQSPEMRSMLSIVSWLFLLAAAVGITAEYELETYTHGEIGLQIRPASSGPRKTYSMVSAGDFNGDEMEDFIIAFPNMLATGTVFVALGGASDEFDVESFASGENGLKIVGAQTNDHFGAAIGAAGDVNGDGFGDFLIGAPGVDTSVGDDVGAVYMIFGRTGPYTDLLMHGFEAGVHGFAIIGEAGGSRFGSHLASLSAALGDINGDGIDDFAIGSAYADVADREEAGAVYIIFGKPTSEAVVSIDLADDFDGAGVMIGGASAGDHLGSSISGAGDVNGDGIRDLLIGCPGCESEGRAGSGAAYLVYCAEDMEDIDLAEHTKHPVIRFHGAAAADLLGTTVSNAADLNGDGLADLVLGAPGAHTELDHDVGCVHVIYGTDAEEVDDTDLADLEAGSSGYTVCGDTVGAKLGSVVAHAGDVNQDGIDDMLLSTADHDGSLYILYGDAEIPHSDVDAAEADACYVLSSSDGAALAQTEFTPNMMLNTYHADLAPLLSGAVHINSGTRYTLDCGPVTTRSPTSVPTHSPVLIGSPTPKPSAAPSKAPTFRPTAKPTVPPTKAPTKSPTRSPTKSPTKNPTKMPTKTPTRVPTKTPTRTPTGKPPTRTPTRTPTRKPTTKPTVKRTAPTKVPTRTPTRTPTKTPTRTPTRKPTGKPSVKPPTRLPTRTPTRKPTTKPTVKRAARPTTATLPKTLSRATLDTHFACRVEQVLHNS